MKLKYRWALILIGGTLILAFQDCGQGKFRPVDSELAIKASNQGTDGTTTPSPQPTPTPIPTPNPVPTPVPTPIPTPSPLPSPLYSDKVFSPNSFWYTPIPANAPLHANSAAYVNEFLRQKAAYYGAVNINVVEYTSPVFVVGNVAPVKVNEWDCQNKGFKDSNLAAQWAQVPMPSYATPAGGTDGEMSIYQPSSDSLWEFWVARKTNGQWEACWGGRMQNVSTSNGIWPQYYGTTATGLPLVGGQITPDELKRGEIRHVIGIALVDLENYNIFSWPAQRSDGSNPGGAANRILEGQRLRLNPNLNVDALNIHPVAKTIAKAAQKYGFVVWDKSGAISLRAENALSYTAQGLPNPYPALFNGKAEYEILNGFPWEQLQFLPKDYGKP